MRYIDWTIQTLIFVIGLLLGIHTWTLSDWSWILILQMMIGPWQMISSTISLLRRSNLWKYKRIHLVLASCYLILVYTLSQFTISIFNDSRIAWSLMLTVPPLGLAIYYYYITWRSTFVKATKKGSFLPNLNF